MCHSLLTPTVSHTDTWFQLLQDTYISVSGIFCLRVFKRRDLLAVGMMLASLSVWITTGHVTCRHQLHAKVDVTYMAWFFTSPQLFVPCLAFLDPGNIFHCCAASSLRMKLSQRPKQSTGWPELNSRRKIPGTFRKVCMYKSSALCKKPSVFLGRSLSVIWQAVPPCQCKSEHCS